MKILKAIKAIFKKLFSTNVPSINSTSIEDRKSEMMLRYYYLGHGMNC